MSTPNPYAARIRAVIRDVYPSIPDFFLLYLCRWSAHAWSVRWRSGDPRRFAVEVVVAEARTVFTRYEMIALESGYAEAERLTNRELGRLLRKWRKRPRTATRLKIHQDDQA
jgi:hypothetical protein